MNYWPLLVIALVIGGLGGLLVWCYVTAEPEQTDEAWQRAAALDHALVDMHRSARRFWYEHAEHKA